MAKRGRPPKHSDESIAALVAAFREYIDTTDMPVISEFAYQHEIDKTLIYDKEEFSTLRKKAIAKKEAYIEKGALTGLLNPTMAIFSLKQMGWRDKQDVEHSGDVGVKIVNDIPRARS